MPRRARKAAGGVIYHVINRGNEQADIFDSPGDFDAFVRVLGLTLHAVPMRLLSYCLMSNHWHLILWPKDDGDLGKFMQRLTVTHVRRWREHRKSVGLGHLYQGTYKSFPVQEDSHFISVCRYVERNALRAGLVKPGHAQDWKWSSAWQRDANLGDGGPEYPALEPWPVDRPANWNTLLNKPQNQAEADAIALSIRRDRPFGDDPWTRRIAKRLGLPATLRPPGRPRKNAQK